MQDARGWSSFTMAHHTAVVSLVNGAQVTLLNQNVGGDRRVQLSTINLGDLKRGSVVFYRPIPRR